jgi:hypothetical protein
MSIVILIAPYAETAATAWTLVQKAGVSAAAPSRREQLSPQQVQQLMLKTLRQRRHTAHANTNLQGPGAALEKIWTELASDLMLGNVDHAQYGWCQTLDEHTPSFWQRFDPETRFVLVYEEPTAFAAQVIAHDTARAQDLQSIMQNWHEQHSQLLDLFYALGVDAVLVHSSQIHRVAAFLDLNGTMQDDQAVRQEILGNRVLNQLLEPMTAANVQVQTLWQELQAAAQGPLEFSLPPLQMAQEVLDQYIQQQAGLEAERQLNDQLDQKLADLKLRHSDKQQEGEKLLVQLYQLQIKLESLQLANGALEKEIEKLRQSEAAYESRSVTESQALQAEALAKTQALTQRDALAHEKEQLSQHLTNAQEEGELLLIQLHEVQEELEKYVLANHTLQQDIEVLRQSGTTFEARSDASSQALQAEAMAKAHALAECDALAQAKEQLSQQLSDAEVAKAQALAQCDALTHEKVQLRQQLIDAQDEGELLLVHLHEVQEELEQYFLKYQDQRQQVKTMVDFWQQNPPTEVWVDMRRTPDGQGWYEAETDGRWSGPSTESALAFPPLGAGQYLVELQIADAMAPELVAGLQLSAQLDDGQVLPVDLVHEFGPADQLYPMVSTGLLPLLATQEGWHLRMTLPSVISPAEQGGTDARQLGLRLQGVRLSLQQVDQSENQAETHA